jgi:uncharacterized protein Yka (UPF0111/DUF47 family)
MTAKVQIVAQLGEAKVLLPELLAAALDANNRAKVRMTLLQEAVAHAQNPASPPQTLEAERRAVGLDLPAFASTVKDAHAVDGGRFAIPGARGLLSGLYADIDTMMAPLRLANPKKVEEFSRRLADLRAAAPQMDGDVLTRSTVQSITSARAGGHDSEHLLIMDVHKALNRLEAEAAVEIVAGARVHGLGALEKRRVEAFMRGLNRTRGLAFGHPGLGTTATRSGKRLIIQNDIGTTDAHVLVIHAEDLAVTITYTDIHRRRTAFFTGLCDGKDVEWSGLAEKSAENLGKNGQFLLVTGRYNAKDAAQIEAFLEYLGSRLVFMIDWNKARKALRNFVDDEAAIAVLRWAAARDYGHRGFLELGGAELIYEAIRGRGAGHVPYGRRLDQALGAKETAEFLRDTLKVASEGLSQGRSVRLLKDEIQAKFASLFESLETSLLTVIGRHLGLSRMMASLILDAIRDGRPPGRASLADQARRLEHKADALTMGARATASRLAASSDPVKAVAESAENANDALEEAAFLLSLAPEGEGTESNIQPLADLAEIAVESVAHMIRAVETVHSLPEGLQADVTDALRAIDAVMSEEKKADEALRNAMAAFISSETSPRMLILRMETARALESSTDCLAHAAFALRERVLGELPA